MDFRILKKILLTILIVLSILPFLGFFILAQNLDCETVEECQELLAEYEKEISEYETDISRTQQQQKTFNNNIYLLKQKINKLSLEIKKSDILINDLEYQIDDTQESIEKTINKIEDSKQGLASILQTINEEDQKSSLEILLTGDNISDFFENVVALENLLVRNQEVLYDIKNLKSDLQEQEVVLGEEKSDWETTMKMQILQEQESQSNKKEEEWLLQRTKGEEAEYQKLLAESRDKAQQIRERLFELVGVPDAPTFGQALEIANYVEASTGVRAELILAVLTQESNIGKNVGQCYLKDPETGSGVGANTGRIIDRVMKPMGLSGRKGDVDDFLAVCKELGRDPYNTRVSCPMSFGYGGAMGPAQFIPTTWAMYKDKIKAITGKPADPWDIKDAFLAAGVLLRDSGAAAQTYNAEWRAAMVYFSGGTNPAYSFYGNSVMAIAKQYESDIAQLEKFN
ncbi:MAG: lytic murein transglycosylase [Candidatus Pacebacteria bacterium]|nr:lytic murein transglycosylase [Candidatus Paceibacterota bacterium]